MALPLAPCTQEETQNNDYNPILLLSNQANVDIDTLPTLEPGCHTTSLTVTKSERSEQGDTWSDIFTHCHKDASNALSFMLRSVKNRQNGCQLPIMFNVGLCRQK